MVKYENIYRWLANKLPAELIYFCGIRLWVNATTGEWSDTEVPGVTMDQILDRWQVKNMSR